MARNQAGSLDPKTECVLAKVVQYECQKSDYIVCQPIERLFKRCLGMPSVELVPENGTYVDIRTHQDVASELGGLARPGGSM
ncbi:hypothetical protein LPJ61_004007 [Coemansia biformis]|uniref:Uncharacterized protein n=1 Tax=Coemansia biformis TaxID=1286918 RepID=A0A9W7YB41_9FUNG|nr:hypothetical protein LPJ61_004007 [Coemansia biformis]